MIENILLVCTGNICRSPVAEYEMKRLAKGVSFSSAGISAMEGAPADGPTLKVAEDLGLDLSGHRARQVSEELLFAHDLVLVMDSIQYDWMRSNFPEDRAKILKLLHWSGGHDIPDPYRRSLPVYEAVAVKIRSGCADWCRQLGLTRADAVPNK